MLPGVWPLKSLDFVLAGGVDANLYPVVLMAFKRLGLIV